MKEGNLIKEGLRNKDERKMEQKCHVRKETE